MRIKSQIIRVARIALAVQALGIATGIRANTELDRKYALEKIGYLKTWDNIDGLFASYVSDAYLKYFEENSRFVLRDLTPAIQVLEKSKIPYRTLVQDPAVIEKIARSARVESMIRTKVLKEGGTYRFDLNWVHFQKGQVIAKHGFEIQDPKPGDAIRVEELKEKIREELTRLIDQVPFKGQVSGRDERWVTVNLGLGSGIKNGDTLVLGTLEDVKVHPLLNSIEDWRVTETGRVVVQTVDQKMAFCKLVTEEDGRKISRYQKIVKIIPRPTLASGVQAEAEAKIPDQRWESPRLGWVLGGFSMGSTSRSYSMSSTSESDSGLGYGGRAQGQLWLTEAIFIEGHFGFGLYSVSESSGSAFDLGAAAGYHYRVGADFFGPKVSVKLGYQSQSHSLPVNTGLTVGPASFSGIFVGVGGDLPIRKQWGGLFDFKIGLFNSVNAIDINTSGGGGVTNVSATLAGYYRLEPRITLRANVDVDIKSADFTNGASLSHRSFTFGPSLLFYF